MKRKSRPQDFLIRPIYPGGLKAMSAFISASLNYPEEARAAGISGTVVVRLSIDHQGQVIKTEVLKGIGYGCDAEAQRVAARLTFKVHKPRQLKVTYFRSINIHFHAPPSPPVLTVNYTVTQEESSTPAKSASYDYSIKLN